MLVVSSVGARAEVQDGQAGRPQHQLWPLALVVVLAVGVTAAYVIARTNFVLDDWFTLRNAHFDGALAAAGSEQRGARPGAWLVYAFVFGVIGRHPLPIVLLQGVIGVGTAVLFFLLLRRLVPQLVASLAAMLWVVLPNHTTLEVWASATNIALAVLLLVAGCYLLSSPSLDRTKLAAVAVVFASSVLCYEATLPCAAAAALVIPWLVARRVRWDAVWVAGLALGASALWIVTHWHQAKSVSRQVADLSQMLGAHLGWGIAPEGVLADLLLVVGLLGIAIAAARVLLPSLRPAARAEEWTVVAGVAVVLLGTLPFAFYLYAPLGAGDRFNAVSSLGGALVWAGIIAMAARLHHVFAATALALLLVAALMARSERVSLWHRAGHDAVAILDGVRSTIPDPDGMIVIGPTPIQQGNVAAFLDESNINAAVKLEYDDPSVRGGISFSQTQFDEVPPELRFDIRTVSELKADTVVEAG